MRSENLDLLDFDTEIDFETAYHLFADHVDLEINPKSPELFDSEYQVNGAALNSNEPTVSSTNLTTDNGVPKDDELYNHSTLPTNLQGHLPSFDLLTASESNAIINFLDNLISEGEVPLTTNSLSENSVVPIKEKTQLCANGDGHSTDTNPFVMQYEPPEIEIAEFTIEDDEFPEHIRNDPVELKKQKHVKAERMRRYNTKNAYEILTSMVRKEMKTKSYLVEKRKSKFMRLQQVYDDLIKIRSANETLEKLLNE